MKHNGFVVTVMSLFFLVSCNGSLEGILDKIDENVTNKLVFENQQGGRLSTDEEVRQAFLDAHSFGDPSIIKMETPSEISLKAYTDDEGKLQVDFTDIPIIKEVGFVFPPGGLNFATVQAGQDITSLSTKTQVKIFVDKEKSCPADRPNCDISIDVDDFADKVKKRYTFALRKYTRLSISWTKFDVNHVGVVCEGKLDESRSGKAIVACDSELVFRIGSAPKGCNYDGTLYGCK